jgi:hypothetical protein
MASSPLRVLLAESGFTDAGVTLRSLCVETGRTLEPSASFLSLPGPADAIEGVAEDVTEVRLLETTIPSAKWFARHSSASAIAT